jgi:hypothetical protein
VRAAVSCDKDTWELTLDHRLFYVFHLMECDVFYDTHPPYEGPGDRCSRNEIAAGTATQFSILGMSTTFCGAPLTPGSLWPKRGIC